MVSKCHLWDLSSSRAAPEPAARTRLAVYTWQPGAGLCGAHLCHICPEPSSPSQGSKEQGQQGRWAVVPPRAHPARLVWGPLPATVSRGAWAPAPLTPHRQPRWVRGWAEVLILSTPTIAGPALPVTDRCPRFLTELRANKN